MMKLKTYTRLVLLVLTTVSFAQTVKISGKLTGPSTANTNEINVFHDGKRTKIGVDIKLLTFNGSVEIKEPQFIEIKSGANSSNALYVVPNTSMELTINKPSFNASIIQIKDGSIKRINAIMDAFYNTINESGYDTTAQNWQADLFDRPEIALKAINNARELIKKEQIFLGQNAPEFEKEFEIFAASFMQFINIDNYSLKEIETILKQWPKQEMKVTALTIPFFKNYLEDLTNAYAARKLQNLDLVFNSLEKGYISGMLASEACLEFIPNQKIINYLFFDKINRELAIGGAKHQKYLDFLFANTSKGVVDQFKEKYETLKASASSSNTANEDRKDAFNFELHDAQGKLYKLEDFKGKLLFIDFWASWCAPCKMQIPYIKEVEKIYEGKDIVFASVSLDKSEEAWLKSAKEENLHGYVLHAKNDFRNPFPMAYGISSIPRFMLIDADGKMISDNAPRPQSKKELMALIDADLYKKELKSIISKHFDALGVDNLKGDKGLVTKSKQSMMGLEIELLKQYSYPNKLRFDYSPVENPQFRMMIGEDFFKPKFFVTNNNSVYGNLKNIKSTAESWHQLLSGFEIFLTQQVVKEEFELADENTSNNENSYVVQFKDETSTTKYFIDKDTYLIKKIISTVLGSPRTGGGTYEAITKYEDYKNSDGVMVPFSINLNNYMTVKVSEAHLKPIDEVVFSNIEKSKI